MVSVLLFTGSSRSFAVVCPDSTFRGSLQLCTLQMLRTTLRAQYRPNVESFTISDYVSIFFFLQPCGNASFHFSLRLHNRAFTCALLIRVMLQGVLPIQNVAAPRRSSPEAPKPNVVYAWRGGPLSPALDCDRTPCCVERAACCTRCVGLRIAHSWRRLQA